MHHFTTDGTMARTIQENRARSLTLARGDIRARLEVAELKFSSRNSDEENEEQDGNYIHFVPEDF